MPNATITIDRLQTFQVALYVAAQVTFNFDFVVRNRVNDFVQLLRRKVFRAQIGVDIGLLQNAPGGGKADSVNVRQRCFDAFVRRNLNS
jgi:hypothetical protein